MKTLTNLTATLKETDFREPHCHHHNIGDHHTVPTAEGKTGVFARHLRVGPAGIIFSDGKTSVVIPKEELWKLIEKHEPALAVPNRIESAPVTAPLLAPQPPTPNK